MQNLYYHDSLGTLHKVEISEDFKSPKSPPGFDPYIGMRTVSAVHEIGITGTLCCKRIKYSLKSDIEFACRYNIHVPTCNVIQMALRQIARSLHSVFYCSYPRNELHKSGRANFLNQRICWWKTEETPEKISDRWINNTAGI